MTIQTTTPIVTPDHYRAVMRHFPTGVAAICSSETMSGAPCGLIVGTFQALSLEPALVTFSVARTSNSWPKVALTGQFSVNILSDGQQSVCKSLASKTGDKFAAIEWASSAYGTPHIAGSLGWIDCRISQELDGGDHVLIIAEVLCMTESEGEPLVFHGGKLGGFRESNAA